MILGIVLPRVEQRWFADLVAPYSVTAAIAMESSVASGMIALTGIVFALAFVMVQFGAVAYSPRLVPWIARDRLLMHAIGIFTATFLYAVAALGWVDRHNNGRVPFLSTAMVIVLLLVSVGIFVGLVQRLRRLQVQSIMIFVGERGREVIDSVYPPFGSPATAPARALYDSLPVTHVLIDSGRPHTIQALDLSILLAASRQSGGVIEVVSPFGDTVGE